MVLQGECPICLFDLILCCLLRHSQYLIKIFLLTHSRNIIMKNLFIIALLCLVVLTQRTDTEVYNCVKKVIAKPSGLCRGLV